MSNLFIPIFLMYARDKILYMIFRTSLNNFLRCPEADGVYWRVKDLSLNFDRQFPMVFIFVLVQDNQQWGLVTKNIGMFLLLKLVLPVDNIIAILECSLFKVQVILSGILCPLSVQPHYCFFECPYIHYDPTFLAFPVFCQSLGVFNDVLVVFQVLKCQFLEWNIFSPQKLFEFGFFIFFLVHTWGVPSLIQWWWCLTHPHGCYLHYF